MYLHVFILHCNHLEVEIMAVVALRTRTGLNFGQKQGFPDFLGRFGHYRIKSEHVKKFLKQNLTALLLTKTRQGLEKTKGLVFVVR